MNEQRSHETTSLIMDTLAAIDRRTLRMEVSLFGPPEAPHMGWVSRTDVAIEDHGSRIGWIEKRIFLWIGALAALVWGANHFLR